MSHIYCGGATTRTVWQLDPADMSKIAESANYGGIIYALTADPDGLIYCGGITTNTVWQLDPADMSKIAESANYGGYIRALSVDPDGLIYCGGDTTRRVYQLDPADMSKIAESARYSGTIRALSVDPDGLIYCGGDTTRKVWQLDPADMSKVAESADYGGDIYALTADPDGLIYCGGITRKVYQLDPSDMSKIAESAGYGGTIYALSVDPDGLIYCGGATTRTVWQLDPTDMSKIAESANYGGIIRALTADPDGLVYCGGDATRTVWQLDPTDMSKIAESANYGGDIYAVAAGPVEAAVEAAARGGLEIGGYASGNVVKIVKGASRGGFEVGGYAAGEVLPYVTGRVRGGFEVGGRAQAKVDRIAAARGGAAAGGWASWRPVPIPILAVTPYIILDRVTEQPLAWLDPTLVLATEIQDLNTYEDTLLITYPANGPDAGKIAEGRKILTRDRDHNWQLYEIMRPEIRLLADGDYIYAECEHESYELRTDKIVTRAWLNETPAGAMADILEAGGSRWEVGTVELNNVVEEPRVTDLNPRAALVYIARTWGGVLRFRVTVSDGRIAGRYVDLLERRGTYTGQRFEFTHNLGDIRVEIDTKDLVTALYGRGMSDERNLDTDEPETLTFGSVEWSKASGNPADKQYGQEWVGDEEARILYGKPDGSGNPENNRHIFDVYESPEAKTPETLLAATWTQLQRRKRPRVSVEATVADLEQIPGFEHEKTRLGDTVFVVARRGEIAVQTEATVYRIERDRNDTRNTRIYLGDAVPVGSQSLQALRELAVKQDKRRFQLSKGRGQATITVSSADTSRMPWHDDIVVKSGDMADSYINEALEMLRDAGGGKLVLKEGWYPVTGPIVLQGGEIVEGQGQTLIELYDDLGNPDAAIFHVTGEGTGEIAVRHMKLSGMNVLNTYGRAIVASNVGRLELEHLDIRKFSQDAISVEDVEEVQMSKLTIGVRESWHYDRIGGAGIRITGCDSVLLEGSRIILCDGEAVVITNCGQAKIVAGNLFEMNNEASGNTNVSIVTVAGLTINGNVFNYGRAGVYFIDSDGAIVTGNVFNNTTSYGGVRAALSDNVNISANIFDSNLAGVYVASGNKNLIADNKIYRNTWGIIINGPSAVKTKVGLNDMLDNTYNFDDTGTDTDTSAMNRY